MFRNSCSLSLNPILKQLLTYETADYLATIYFRTDHNFQKQLLTGGSNSG